MKDYGDFTTQGADNVRKAGSTQPLPRADFDGDGDNDQAGDGARPNQGGSVPAVVGGNDGPVVRPGGATNNGMTRRVS